MSDTRIHDLGYRAYSGERLGVGWAVRSLVLHTIRRSLGLKRTARHKIAPFVTVAICYLPALFMTAFAAFIGSEFASELVSYGEYFGLTSFAVFLFAAASVPGVITADRTNGMLALYLASPLTRTTYVLARALGVFLVMLIVTVGPILFLILGYTFAGAGPGGVADLAEVIGRAFLAGGLTAALFTGISLFVSSIPRRWSIASVTIVAVFMVSAIVTAGLTEELDISRWVFLASPSQIITEAGERLMDDNVLGLPELDSLAGWAVVGGSVAYAVASLAATWWRYQRMPVER